MSAKALVKALATLNKSQVLDAVKTMKGKGIPPMEIIEDLQEGMRLVGVEFECERYFLSELIMSVNIFKETIDILGDSLTLAAVEPKYGKFVIGTVAGDLHDIGKNIVATIFSCNGFEVIDLGVDVPVNTFVQAVNDHEPGLVGLSCLLTTAFDSMRDTIKAIDQAGLRSDLNVLIGGAPVNQTTCDYVGADAFCTNANEAVETAKRMLGGA